MLDLSIVGAPSIGQIVVCTISWTNEDHETHNGFNPSLTVELCCWFVTAVPHLLILRHRHNINFETSIIMLLGGIIDCVMAN